MKLVLISDTHTYHDRVFLPDGDVLIHCGDFSHTGTLEQVESFLDWFLHQPHEYKIFICGNHEIGVERDSTIMQTIVDSQTDKTFFLHNQSVTINGIKFHGFPYSPIFLDWAFMKNSIDIGIELNKIPLDTDVLITHSPPMGILDVVPSNSFSPKMNVGSMEMMERVLKINPRIHCFGHIHESYGALYSNGIELINCSVCDGDYRPINKPAVYEL